MASLPDEARLCYMALAGLADANGMISREDDGASWLLLAIGRDARGVNLSSAYLSLLEHGFVLVRKDHLELVDFAERTKRARSTKPKVFDDDWVIPDFLESPEVREWLFKFACHRKDMGKPIPSLARASLILKRFDSQEHLIYAIETVIACNYQGLKPDYRPQESRDSRMFVSFAKQRDANTIEAGQRFVERLTGTKGNDNEQKRIAGT